MSSRILVVTASAAASRYWETALPSLRAQGVDAELATIERRGPLHETLIPLGVPVHALDAGSIHDYPLAIARLARLRARRRYDLVHAHETVPALVSAAGTMSRQQVTVYHRHHRQGSARHRAFSRAASRLSTYTVAVSKAAAEQAVAEGGIRRDRLLVAYNGVPAARPVPEAETLALRRALGIPDSALVVVSVGRLRREKGLQTFLRCLPLVSNAARIHAVVVGAGPYRSELAALESAATAAGGTVHMVGHQADVAPWLAMAAVVVVPSHEEAFGLTAVEAWAANRPLVATAVGSLTEILRNGTDSLLVRPADEQALADSISRLLGDRRLADGLAAAGHERYTSRFTVEAMTGRWIQIYRMATSPRTAP